MFADGRAHLVEPRLALRCLARCRRICGFSTELPVCWWRSIIAAIRAAGDGFQTYLDADTPSPLTERDTVERNDPAWTLAAGLYVDARRKVDEAAESLDRARERLVGLASHASEPGRGATLTRLFKQRNVE